MPSPDKPVVDDVDRPILEGYQPGAGLYRGAVRRAYAPAAPAGGDVPQPAPPRGGSSAAKPAGKRVQPAKGT